MTESLTRWQGKKNNWPGFIIPYSPPELSKRSFQCVHVKQQKLINVHCSQEKEKEKKRKGVVWLISVTTDILKYIFGISGCTTRYPLKYKVICKQMLSGF